MTHVIHKLSFGDKLQVSPDNSLALGECSESALILDTVVLWKACVSLQCKLKSGRVHSLGQEQCHRTTVLVFFPKLENSTAVLLQGVRNEGLWLSKILVLA